MRPEELPNLIMDDIPSSPLSSPRSDISVPSEFEVSLVGRDHADVPQHIPLPHHAQTPSTPDTKKASSPLPLHLAMPSSTEQVKEMRELMTTPPDDDASATEKQPLPVDSENDPTNGTKSDTEMKEHTVTPTNGASIAPAVAPEETPTSRPKRARKAPTRLDDATEMAETPLPKAKRLPRAAKEPNYTPRFVLTSEKSILAKIDLDKLFNNDLAWTKLSREAQARLLTLLPNVPQAADFPEDMLIPNIPKELLKGNSAFKTDLRIFQEDLTNGRLNERWRQEAAEAMRERAEGKYDNWKNEEREEFWGQKMRGTNADR